LRLHTKQAIINKTHLTKQLKGRIMLNNQLPAVHAGEFLAEILEDIAITQASFARAIGASTMRI
jgi:hypothetical protein